MQKSAWIVEISTKVMGGAYFLCSSGTVRLSILGTTSVQCEQTTDVAFRQQLAEIAHCSFCHWTYCPIRHQTCLSFLWYKALCRAFLAGIHIDHTVVIMINFIHQKVEKQKKTHTST